MPPPEKRRKPKATPKLRAMLECHRCGGREVIAAKIGVEVIDGKPSGGTKSLLCAGCLLRGERVTLL